MEFLDVFALSGLINGLFTLGLGVFIISINWRDKTNRLYFLIVLATGLWSFSYWRWLSSHDAVSALFWVRMLSVGSTLIPVFYFHWVASLLKIEERQKATIKLIYILGALFVSFSFSKFFISGVEQKLFFPFWPNPGFLYHFYLFILYICVVAYSTALLIKSYKATSGEEKKRLAYIFAGAVVAFIGGASNFFLWYDIPIAPYGNFLITFYPVLFGYATIRYRLFNIKVISTELFIIAIWIFLFVKILVSISLNDLFVNIILFFSVVFFGILTIRSVLKELRQKDEMEKMAKSVQRAYEVEKHANEELKKIDETKNQFMAITNHHLRTPLTAINWYIDLLSSGKYGKLSVKSKNIINRIKTSTTEEIKIVDDLLDVSQLQLGKEIVETKQKASIEEMFKQIAENEEPEVKEKGIYLRIEKPKNVPLIPADKNKLKIALENIVDNAVKYTEKGGVTIKLQSEKEKLKISITDTGIGMDEPALKNIFSKTFERGDQAQKIFATGRGIGLYLSAKIIEAHHGKIWAESAGKGKGSTFIVELPVARV